MKGWMYIDTAGNPDFRTDEFLSEFPAFFVDNRDFIIQSWRIDTDDIAVMRNAYQGWAQFEPKNDAILLFSTRIGFDVKNASRLRNGQ